MKKKLMFVICVMVLTLGTAMNVMAEVSPAGTGIDDGSGDGRGDGDGDGRGDGGDNKEKAPKTGESDLLIYGITAAALFAGTAVISRSKLEAMKQN